MKNEMPSKKKVKNC